MTEPVLEIKNLSFDYQGNQILSQINLELHSGDNLGIVGPNGGGKSTLLKIIAGLLNPTSGELKYKNVNNVGYVPQTLSLNEMIPLSIEQMLRLNLKDESTSDRIHEVLKLVDLEKKKSYLIRHLSGGEKQRAIIARSLINFPDLLILDEPSNGLDSNGQDQLYDILVTIKKNLKTALVIVDHNLNQILKNSDKILCLNKTQHWHNHTQHLTKDILSSIYHCEFEHLMIHEQGGAHHTHEHCDHDHGHGGKHHFIKPK